ncbi:sulfurtransferase TusA [Enterobacteriaceae endosymbiont of Donacia tomentosa]|uniref:sulfurtransferase TusA family protein n=1 Tax=Enterobacteriaceae endosymbiont of Donacia tomentosa TaxID=2675787 RepID=UPI001449CD03|nr:sulfurtransferase TusA family protein [Enterobacteriaceae endosymbiont of Donacia tomentosa]QJC31488.1 sulfurtransferase TusA [Enterobacteriaceae endosymbiont of Donacia tomentosa]
MFKKSDFYRNPNYILDIQGFDCPKTIMMIKKNTLNMKKKETLLIIADNDLVILDIKYFCQFTNYIIIKQKIVTKPYLFLIKKI